MWRIEIECKMQQIWGVFDQCEEYACMLHIILLRAHFSQNVKYLYEIRDVLVPVFHALWGIGTNFSRSKICEVWNLRFDSASTSISRKWFNISGQLIKISSPTNVIVISCLFSNSEASDEPAHPYIFARPFTTPNERILRNKSMCVSYCLYLLNNNHTVQKYKHIILLTFAIMKSCVYIFS